jgi:hypothetical protein
MDIRTQKPLILQPNHKYLVLCNYLTLKIKKASTYSVGAFLFDFFIKVL